MIGVMYVDDHPLMREGIATVIRSQPDMTLVVEASNGREAIEAFRKHRPDVTLMDLRLPDMSGIDALVAIRTEFPDARVIMLSDCGSTTARLHVARIVNHRRPRHDAARWPVFT